jgi:SAM-dependent methyltransferase
MGYEKIRDRVREYYGERVQTFGATAKGVDWNSPESQRLRFVQLLKLFDPGRSFSLNDYGCGYGALAAYLKDGDSSFSYCGFDICLPMISRAKELYGRIDRVDFVSEEQAMTPADYTVASGVFNVRLDTSTPEWETYVLHNLGVLNALSLRGFAFNLLSKYSDPELMRGDLYYADPLFFFDYCKNNFSRFVALLHDYPLYEFTILVKDE